MIDRKNDKEGTNLDRLNTTLAHHILNGSDDSNLGRLNKRWARWHLAGMEAAQPQPKIK